MGERTYYMILGVSRTESPGGIRSAYHDLARKLHPDVAGEQATRAFQEITEAYDVLSDPRRRRAYNDALRRLESGDVASRLPAPAARAPVSDLAGAERLGEPSSPSRGPKAQHLDELNIEVVLTPEEGRRGCTLPFDVPVFRRCRCCGGSGRDWLFPCLACGQEGVIEQQQLVPIRIPPMVRSGSIIEIPLRGLGIHDLHLRLRVFVEAQVANEAE